MIDLELYKIFYIVGKTGNITEASKKLNISQPAVTKHIKNLESALGTPLFIRTKKGVILNECGEKIFLKVKHALTLLEEVEHELLEYTDLNTGTIRIGISTTLVKKYLLQYLKAFHNDFPNIIVDIYTDPTAELIKKLKSGQVDFIIGKLPEHLDTSLNYKELGKTRYVFVANGEYFNVDKIKVSDLNSYPILLPEHPSNSRINIEKYFKDNSVEITPKMNIASSNLLIDFIKMGYGIAPVTELYIKDELENKTLNIIEVIPPPSSISFGIISLKNEFLTPHSKKFIKYITKKD